MKCDQCAGPVAFLVHAAYSVAVEYDAHPRVAHYPGVMIRACPEHLAELLERDSDSFTATKQYLVNVAPDLPEGTQPPYTPHDMALLDSLTYPALPSYLQPQTKGIAMSEYADLEAIRREDRTTVVAVLCDAVEWMRDRPAELTQRAVDAETENARLNARVDHVERSLFRESERVIHAEAERDALREALGEIRQAVSTARSALSPHDCAAGVPASPDLPEGTHND